MANYETKAAGDDLIEKLITVNRVAKVVKGGRVFGFSALVVVGDRNGRLGVGYGKANQVPPAIEKAQKEARRRMRPYPLQGRTIPHAVTGRFGSCMVRLVPASPGTGVIAGAAVHYDEPVLMSELKSPRRGDNACVLHIELGRDAGTPDAEIPDIVAVV